MPVCPSGYEQHVDEEKMSMDLRWNDINKEEMQYSGGGACPRAVCTMPRHTRCGHNGLFLIVDEDRAFRYHNIETDIGDPMEAYWRKNCPTTNLTRTGRGLNTEHRGVTRLRVSD